MNLSQNNFSISTDELIEWQGTHCLTNFGKGEYSMSWKCMQEQGLLSVSQWFHKIALICFIFGLLKFVSPYVIRYFKIEKLWAIKLYNDCLDASVGFLLMAMGLISWWLVSVKL